MEEGNSFSNILSDAPTQSTPTALNTSFSSNAAAEPESPAEHHRIGGELYYLGIDIAKKRKRTSWIWDHGIELFGVNNMKAYWKCSLCKDITIYSAHTTDHATNHLRRKHRLAESGHIEINPFTRAAPATPPPANINTVVTRVQLDMFKRLLVQWIAVKHISFSQVESSEFRELIFLLSPGLSTFLPLSGKTVQVWIIDAYEACKEKLRNILLGVIHQIHITFDTWTSPNMQAFIACNAHFAYKGKVVTALLGLRALIGSHSGENMAATLLPLFKEYDITEKLGYFVLDNASNNNTCVRHVLSQTSPEIGPGERRIRCFGHVLNLAASEFLFGKHPEVFEAEANLSATLNDETKERDIWRAKGPIGKLHRLVIHIRRTPQRRQEFLGLRDQSENSIPLMVIQDNETRWNSKYNMALRALKLKDRIQLYTFHWRERTLSEGQIPAEDVLTTDDWTELKDITEILEPFEILTRRLQGNSRSASYGAIWEVLPAMEYLFIHLQTMKHRLELMDEMKPLKVGLNLAIIKLEEYYALLDESGAIIGSLVLNPKYKWTYLERRWGTGAREKKRLSDGKAWIKTMWTAYLTTPPPSPPRARDRATNHEPDLLEEFMAPDPGEQMTGQRKDEYERYCEGDTVEHGSNLIEWWTARQIEYPRLSIFALNLLSAPAMAAECERVFSYGKLLLTDRRNRLSTDSVEANECLRAWYHIDFLRD